MKVYGRTDKINKVSPGRGAIAPPSAAASDIRLSSNKELSVA